MDARTIAMSAVGEIIANIKPRDSAMKRTKSRTVANIRNLPKSAWKSNIRYDIIDICTEKHHKCFPVAIVPCGIANIRTTTRINHAPLYLPLYCAAVRS